MKRSIPTRCAESGGVPAKLLLWLVVLFAFAAIAWMVFLPRVVAAQIRSRTGFVVTVDHLSVNPCTARVSIQGMVLNNPPDWPTGNFVELREFKADAEVRSLFSDRIIADEVVVDIARFTLVKNQQGAVNAKVFSDAIAGKPAAPATKPAGPAKTFLIRRLVMKFGQLVYADYSGGQPVVREFDVNMNQEFQDVDSLAKIIKPIASRSFGSLLDVVKGAANEHSSLLNEASESIKSLGKKTSDKFKAMMDALDKQKP